MTIPTTTSISSWNRATKRVEADIRTGKYLSAETALIFAGPPRLTDVGSIDANIRANSTQGDNVFGTAGAGDMLYPIGQCEQFAMQQFQNVQKMFEIGSRRSLQAGGRVQVSGSLGRVMFNGPSLLRVLYAYYPALITMANGKLLGRDSGGTMDTVSNNAVAGNSTKQVFPQIYFEAGALGAPLPEQPNAHSFMINLMSELFAQPFGMGLILRDNANRNIGAFYCEDCMVTTHSLSVSASSSLLTEAVNFQCDAAVPMEFATGEDQYQIKPLSAV
jgi:hypothetical protein